MRTCLNKRFACFVGRVFSKVFDKSSCKVLRFSVPFRFVCVGISGIEDFGSDSVEFGRYFEIEVRNFLRGSVVDIAVKDSVDDTSGIFDGDTFARSVPAGVYEVRFCSAHLHFLNEFFRVFGRVEFEERLSEASRESRSRFGNSSFRSGKFSRKSAEEVVLSLLGSKNGYRGKYAESVCRKENNVLCRRCAGNRTYDVFNMVNRVRNTGIFGYALVRKVDFAVFVESYVFEKRVASDSVVDVRFGIFVEVDYLA